MFFSMSQQHKITQKAPSCEDSSTLSAPTNQTDHDDSLPAQMPNREATLLAAECKFDDIAEPDVDYSEKPEAPCVAIGDVGNQNMLESICFVTEYGSKSKEWTVCYKRAGSRATVHKNDSYQREARSIENGRPKCETMELLHLTLP